MLSAISKPRDDRTGIWLRVSSSVLALYSMKGTLWRLVVFSKPTTSSSAFRVDEVLQRRV